MRTRIYQALIFILAIAITATFYFRYSKGNEFMWGDAFGYYLYLPSAFVYGNLDDMSRIPEEEASFYHKEYVGTMKKTSNELGYENALNQYTYAVAFMEAPFFLSAHLYEKAVGLPANGFGDTYRFSILLYTWLITAIGFILLYRVLRRWFLPVPSLLSLVLIFLGTHMYYFVLHKAGMSHLPLFFLYSVLIWLTVKVHEKPKGIYFALAGLVAGFITIMRPTDIICLAIPFLYGVYDKATFKHKLKFIRSNIKYIILAAIIFILPSIPQMIYWKLVTGKFLVYSYGEQEFYWMHPKLKEGLFYFSNGWLPYAPIMIFALAGIVLYKRIKPWFWIVALMLPMYVYIIYSWYCYNYINGLGSRPMIHMYPLLSIPFAAYIQYVIGRHWVGKVLFGGVSLFFVAVMFSISSVTAKGMYDSEYATSASYFSVLFKINLDYKALVAADIEILIPDDDEVEPVKVIAHEDFNDSLNEHYAPDPDDSGYVYHYWEDEDYADKLIRFTYHNGDFEGGKWLKCSVDAMYPDLAEDLYLQRILVFEVKSPDGEIKLYKGLKIENKIGISDSSCEHYGKEYTFFHREYWKWGMVYFYCRIPPDIEDGDTVSLFVWNRSIGRVFIDDLKLELYR